MIVLCKECILLRLKVLEKAHYNMNFSISSKFLEELEVFIVFSKPLFIVTYQASIEFPQER